MAETYSAGIVTAYGAAVRGGYTGTYEEFCAEQASFAENAEQVAQDREAMETLAAQFIGTTVPAAVQTVQNAGAAQIQAVEAASETEQQQIAAQGAAQETRVTQAGSDQVAAIQAAGETQVGNVNAAGTTQVGNVNTAGTTQVNAVQAKGQEVIDSIPEDFTDLQNEVGDLKSALADETACEPITEFTTGKAINTSGSTVDVTSPTTVNGYQYKVVDCSPGDLFTVSGSTASGNYRLWCFVDGSGNKLSEAPTRTSGSYFVVAPTSAAKLIINQEIENAGFCCTGYNAPERLDNAEKIISEISENTYNTFFLKNYGVVPKSNVTVAFDEDDATIASTGSNANAYAHIPISDLSVGEVYYFRCKVKALSGTPYIRVRLRGTTENEYSTYDGGEKTPTLNGEYGWLLTPRAGCNGIVIYVSGSTAASEAITLTDLMLVKSPVELPYLPHKTAYDGVMRDQLHQSKNLASTSTLTPIDNCKIEEMGDGSYRIIATANNAWSTCYFPIADLEVGASYYLHAKIDWRKSTTGIFRFRLIGTTDNQFAHYGGFMLDSDHAVVGEYGAFATPVEGCRGAVIYIANTSSTNAGFVISEVMLVKSEAEVPFIKKNTVKDYDTQALSFEHQEASKAYANAEVMHSHFATYAKRKARVSIIDDDGRIEFYTKLLPMIRTYHVPIATAYAADTNGWRGDGKTYMTIGQLKEIVAAGGEVIAHGTTDLTSVSIAEAEANVKLCYDNLMRHGFRDFEYYVYPYGATSEAVREMIAKYYKCGINTVKQVPNDAFRTNMGCIGNYYINRQHCGGAEYDGIVTTGPYGNLDTSKMEYFEALIQEAIDNNSWLILYTHSFQMESGQQPTDGVTQFQRMEEIIQHILTLKAGGTDIDIITVKDGFEMFGNAMQFGDYLGPWNETAEHSQPGAAINKLGQYDFPAGNNLNV